MALACQARVESLEAKPWHLDDRGECAGAQQTEFLCAMTTLSSTHSNWYVTVHHPSRSQGQISKELHNLWPGD